MELDSAHSGISKPKYSRPNTALERREYQKRRRERQRSKRKGKSLISPTTLKSSALRAERELLFPSVKAIPAGELKVIGSDSVLGSGAFGQVRIRQWRSMVVAVKTVTGDSAARKILTEAFHLEGCNKYKIHPNVLFFVGVAIPKNQQQLRESGASLVTEFCMIDGQSVTLANLLGPHQQHLQNLITELRLQLRIVLDIVSGLRHIHQASILHNDLHAGNVLMKKNLGCSRITAVIADFGLSSTLTTSQKYRLAPSAGQSPEEARKEFRRKHPHVAPEVIGISDPNTQSDIYSLGYLIKAYTHAFPGTCTTLRPIATECLCEQHERPELARIYSSISASIPDSSA